MRRPLIAGNWKMHTDASSAQLLAAGVASRVGEFENVDLLICPPSIYLSCVGKALGAQRDGTSGKEGPNVAYGAQNMHFEASGAFTGEISARMLVDVGATHVILGHSERRHLFHETDAEVNKKTLAALAAGLTPIVCVGELLEEREAGQTQEVIRRQFAGSLAGLSSLQMLSTVIAYEPVWAIGTGRVATPAQAEEVHADLRKLIAAQYNADVASQVRILYGGSVKPDNASELIGQLNVDGALVGGASLNVDDFLAIAAGANAVAN